MWLPWHDVSVARGGLVMLEGSSRLDSYRQMRDTCASAYYYVLASVIARTVLRLLFTEPLTPVTSYTISSRL